MDNYLRSRGIPIVRSADRDTLFVMNELMHASGMYIRIDLFDPIDLRFFAVEANRVFDYRLLPRQAFDRFTAHIHAPRGWALVVPYITGMLDLLPLCGRAGLINELRLSQDCNELLGHWCYDNQSISNAVRELEMARVLFAMT